MLSNSDFFLLIDKIANTTIDSKKVYLDEKSTNVTK